jgi:hypothetical protein
MPRSLLLFAALAVSPLAGAQMSPTAPTTQIPNCPDIPPIPQGPLGELDRSFLDSYCALKPAILAHQSAYVVVSGASLILHWSGPTTRAPEKQNVIPEKYHALKDVAHVPFTLYLLLLPLEKSYAGIETQKPALLLFKDRLEKAEAALDSTYFSPEQLARQKRIFAASHDLLNHTLQTGTVSSVALGAFAKEMGPLLLQDANEAACEQIKTTHAQMMAWKKQLTPDEWSHLVVINVSGHQPRYRNVETQYFHWLLGDGGSSWSYPGETLRLIYAETLNRGEDATDILASAAIDAAAGEAFFNNPWRMSEDVLSEGAASCIAALPPSDRLY